MSKPTFIDTSYVLALLNTHDKYHRQAQNLASEIDSKLLTTEAILTEIGNALAKLKWRELAVSTLDDIRGDEDIEILSVNSTLFTKALNLYASRMDKTWGLTDCISFIVMKEKALTEALTADHHFEQAGFKALLIRD